MSKIKRNDKIHICGGFNLVPLWLNGGDGYLGVVDSFIPGQNQELAVVVKLNSPITVDEVVGEILVLELRYEEATWTDSGIVHVELCDFYPEEKSWANRKQGKWVESHASYKLVKNP